MPSVPVRWSNCCRGTGGVWCGVSSISCRDNAVAKDGYHFKSGQAYAARRITCGSHCALPAKFVIPGKVADSCSLAKLDAFRVLTWPKLINVSTEMAAGDAERLVMMHPYNHLVNSVVICQIKSGITRGEDKWMLEFTPTVVEYLGYLHSMRGVCHSSYFIGIITYGSSNKLSTIGHCCPINHGHNNKIQYNRTPPPSRVHLWLPLLSLLPKAGTTS